MRSLILVPFCVGLTLGLLGCVGSGSTAPDGSYTEFDSLTSADTGSVDSGVLLDASAGSDAAPDAQPTNPAAELPLLDHGSHLGMIVGFNAQNPVATQASINAHWTQALEAGMKIGRVQVDWSELEPTRGQFDTTELAERLEALSSDSLQPFLLMAALDEGDGADALPADLAVRVRSGELKIDSPEVLSRFASLLNGVVPMLLRHGGWILALVNEPGNVIDELPADQRQAAAESIANFVRMARDHVHSIEPRLAVTMTLREDLSLAADVSYLPALIEPLDVLSFNFYCSRFADDLRVQSDANEVRAYIQRMLDVAPDRQLVIQELGCHGGVPNSPTGATEALQAAFHQTVYDALYSEPRFRAAIAFQLVDWDPALVESFYSRHFREAGVPEAFITRFAESLETVGFVRYQDGSERLAWQTFIGAL